MKKCLKCGELKSVESFYKHIGMKDGYLNKCKICICKYAESYRENNDHVRMLDRIRSKTRKRKEHISIIAAKFRRENPLKYKAHNKVSNSIRDGKLFKKPCKVCGNKIVHAHHDDYNKPLNVIWLCPRHHSLYHKKKVNL